MTLEKEWFSEWFNSPYYHILYKSRDAREAEYFLRNLVRRLHFNKHQQLIDLACGKGRHSIFLNKLGFDVTGIDLAKDSIAFAKTAENERLHFEIQDLRDLPYHEQFDVALNLFTSFGYFDCDDTNQLVMRQIYQILKQDGLVVIDFMNVDKVLSNLAMQTEKEVDGIVFYITKEVKNGLIIKQIRFTDAGQTYHFKEEVQILHLKDFERLFALTGFDVEFVFGNYKLEPFNVDSSDRLIVVGKKHV